MVWIAIAAALCSAFCLAFGAHFQSQAVRNAVDGLDLTLKNVGKLASNKRWMSGLGLMALGMALNVFALASAPLTVVQPIGAIALVITAMVNAKETDLTMNRPTVLAIISCMVGSVGFVLLAVTATNGNQEVTETEAHLIEMILAVVVAIVGLATIFFHKKLGAFFFILGAGVLFGFVAVLVRTIAIAVLNIGDSSFFQLPWLAGLSVAVAGLLGSYFVQKAYSKGPPDLVIAGLTVIDPIIGIAIGISILGELRADVPVLVTVLMLVAAGLAIVGVTALSRHHPDVIERRNKTEGEKSMPDSK
ncbi:DMT family transporter [Glutamicibacter nicotianae]|uniref:DMT family transporter n=1 Tax=Glutamicibacter nicotianae TaxID=37929 RepID=UPI0019589100|nr:DMT family transporter [Glutamicibacter nicotianae]MBM7767814.1 drug/metabolite transporter (DMT)-like permease [Glutamicibacter nicotianae]